MSPQNASDPGGELIAASARFAADIARLLGQSPERLALAVSGGPDSMALLALAHHAFPGRVAVATVDHGLRAGSADEAAMVARYCAALSVPHATLTPAAPIVGASIQARARDARYTALAEWARSSDAGPLVTAHHADDQAETFLMRANRASGVAGLSGIRAHATIADACVIRPLLGWRRAALRTIAERAGAPFVDDPSNDDPRHDRTRIRAMLAATPLLDPASLAQSAAALAEGDAALAFAANLLWEDRERRGGGSLQFDVRDLPREFRRRLVRRALAEAGEDARNVEPLLDSLEAGIRATQGTVMATPRGTMWRFEKAPPRRSH